MRFTKMHGIGNDYVYVNGFAETVADPSRSPSAVADRHFGIGGDGLILILPSGKADVRMRMFNADGSEAEMCGNGVRCVAKYAFDHGLTRNNPMTVETGRGVLTLALDDRRRQGPAGDRQHGRADPGAAGNPGGSARASPGAAREHEYRLTAGPANGRSMPPSSRWATPTPSSSCPTSRRSTWSGSDRWWNSTPPFPRRINAHWVQVHSPGK